MSKNARLVVLLEPKQLAQLRSTARQNHEGLSEIVRRSIQYFLSLQKVQARMRQVHKLGQFRLSLHGLEDPTSLEQALAKNYRS